VRSRSRQNVTSPEVGGLVREINFEPDAVVTPTRVPPNQHNHHPLTVRGGVPHDTANGDARSRIPKQNHKTHSDNRNKIAASEPVRIELESDVPRSTGVNSHEPMWMKSSKGLTEAEELLERLRKM